MHGEGRGQVLHQNILRTVDVIHIDRGMPGISDFYTGRSLPILLVETVSMRGECPQRPNQRWRSGTRLEHLAVPGLRPVGVASDLRSTCPDSRQPLLVSLCVNNFFFFDASMVIYGDCRCR